MGLYFFDIVCPNGGRWDEIGVECADPEAARQIAKRTIYDVAADENRNADATAFKVRVRDNAGAEIYSATLTFSESTTSG